MINLFINPYYNVLRDEEFKTCLKKNEQNKFIDRIIFVRENDKATFQDFFYATHKYPNDVNIISNLDIYFDDTIELAQTIKHSECYSLTRWEQLGGNIMKFTDRHPDTPACWSQDAWIFYGAVNLEGFEFVMAINTERNLSEKIQFTMGIPGSDNKLAAMLKAANYKVTNPSLSIRAIHLHKEESRNYGQYRILQGIKPWGLVMQTTL